MKGYLDNLRPFERRVVVIVGVVLFVVLNFWLVFPHFSDWNKVQDRMWEANRKLNNYEKEIQQMGTYSNLVQSLESEGLEVPAEDQASHFQTAVQSQAAQSRVTILQNSRISTRTNQFFLEMSQSIQAQAGEQQLVDFLYSLGSGNSLIRARGLSIRPDPPRMQLLAGVTLVASYQKKSAAKPGTTPANQPTRRTPPPVASAAPAPKPEPPLVRSANPPVKRP